MKAITTDIEDVLILEPQIFRDDRGYFFESYNRRKFTAVGINADFVQDNQSSSLKGVVRGLHYQIHQPQGKLIRVLAGAIFDVAVDLRRSSKTFGKWVGVELSSKNRRMLWIPRGFAHGFQVLSDEAEVMYKTDGFYAPEFERTINWNDPEIAIKWPIAGTPTLSPKDAAGASFRESETYD
jgi:dTDP-4-dehydrorhamnose 3,5-epimerase